MRPQGVLLLIRAGDAVGSRQSPGTFEAMGRLTADRMGHIATLLTDGQRRDLSPANLITAPVLFSTPGDGATVRAPFCTPPHISSFPPTTQPFPGTLLNNGQVLITGGFTPLSGKFGA